MLKAQEKSEKKVWDQIRERRGLYLRTIFEGHVSELLIKFMSNSKQRNSIAHADERIDHGTYWSVAWRWKHHDQIDAIAAALTQFARVAESMGFTIYKHRVRLRRQRAED